jgi:hypothetical protein
VDDLAGDLEDNQDDQEAQHLRRKDTPGGVVQSQQGQKVAGQRGEGTRQERAKKQSEKSKRRPYRPLVITSGPDETQAQKSNDPNHEGRLMGGRGKSTQKLGGAATHHRLLVSEQRWQPIPLQTLRMKAWK